MALAPDELAQVRDWVGGATPPTDPDLDAIHDRVGGTAGVVRSVWAGRLAALLSDPASFSIGGEYSQSTAANIKAIQELLGQLSALPDDGDLPPFTGGGAAAVGVAQLVRCDPSR